MRIPRALRNGTDDSTGTRGTAAEGQRRPPSPIRSLKAAFGWAWLSTLDLPLEGTEERPTTLFSFHRRAHPGGSEGARSGPVAFHCPSCSRTFADFPDWDAHVRLSHLA